MLRQTQKQALAHGDSFEELLDPCQDENAEVTVSGWEDIIVPSVECSRRLIAYDRIWNSWVHYAVEYPHFEADHEEFLTKLDGVSSLREIDPVWLAIYFSVLSVCTRRLCPLSKSTKQKC